jgi:hypothetical protein
MVAVGFTPRYTTRDRLHNSAMLGPSHPDTNARCTAMIRPCKTSDDTALLSYDKVGFLIGFLISYLLSYRKIGNSDDTPLL